MRLIARFRCLALAACTTALAALAVPDVHAEGLELTGDVRLRLRYIDSARPGALEGTYRETLRRGFSETHRFVLEASYPLGSAFKVGGIIRVSNEDEAVLRSGPEYLASDFGSAYVAYQTAPLTSRLGYFPIHYTPLSLMRWDLKDDPEGGGGGCAVCPGTPGVAGAILGETLEELGPDLTFEGLRTVVTPGQTLGVDGFFTRSEVEDANYPVLTFGGRLGLTRYLGHASSFLNLDLLAVRSEEDPKAFEGMEGTHPDPFRNTVWGIAWKVPAAAWIEFDGEWVRTRTLDMEGRPQEMEGAGGIIGLSVKPARALEVEASYIYLSPHWESYFRALSYSPDRRGTRLRMEVKGSRLVLALFAKYLTTIEAPREHRDAKTAYPTLSARGYLKLTPVLNLGAGAIYSGEGPENGGLTINVDDQRISLLGAVRLVLREDASITVEERYILNRSETEKDYRVSSLSVYARAAIW
jgi:hypothetical protein